MSKRFFEVLSWLDRGYITDRQFDEWVETRVFLAFSVRCKDLRS
jgi:hypothetical protein